MTTIPEPPEGFRLATSVYEVLEAGSVRGRERDVLRLYVNREWVAGRLDIAIGSQPKRPISRNVAVTWAGPSHGLGHARRLPFERIAIPEENPDARVGPTGGQGVAPAGA